MVIPWSEFKRMLKREERRLREAGFDGMPLQEFAKAVREEWAGIWEDAALFIPIYLEHKYTAVICEPGNRIVWHEYADC